MQVGSITGQHPVNSIEGVPLAKVGDKVTPEFIQEVSLKRTTKPTRVPFFSTASFQSDIETFLSEQQYERIFPTDESKARTLQAVRQHSIYTVVADVLSYVKTLDYDAYRHLLVCSALATRLAIDLQV